MSQNNLYIRAKEILEELLLQADTLLNDHNNVVVPNSISTEYDKLYYVKLECNCFVYRF